MRWLIFLTLIVVKPVFAFNWQKCKSWGKKHSVPIFPIEGLTSTSSFFTSTGDCAMIGQAEHDQKVFLAMNLDKIKLDSARGGGEYLEAYAHIANIRKEDQAIYFAKIQKNYSSIFRDEDVEVAIFLRSKKPNVLILN